jgi:hypothetical protein
MIQKSIVKLAYLLAFYPVPEPTAMLPIEEIPGKRLTKIRSHLL